MVYIYYRSDVEKKVSLSRANKTLMSLKHNLKEYFFASLGAISLKRFLLLVHLIPLSKTVWFKMFSRFIPNQTYRIFIFLYILLAIYIVILEISISFSVTDLVRNILHAFTIFILF